MCVCVCVCMCVYVCVWKRERDRQGNRIYTYIYMYTRIPHERVTMIPKYICTLASIHTYLYMYTRIPIYLCIYIHTRIPAERVHERVMTHSWLFATLSSWLFESQTVRDSSNQEEEDSRAFLMNESRQSHDASKSHECDTHSSWKSHEPSMSHEWDTRLLMKESRFIPLEIVTTHACIYETWLIRIWDMTHSYMRRDSVTCVTWLVTTHWYVIQSHI